MPRVSGRRSPGLQGPQGTQGSQGATGAGTQGAQGTQGPSRRSLEALGAPRELQDPRERREPPVRERRVLRAPPALLGRRAVRAPTRTRRDHKVLPAPPARRDLPVWGLARRATGATGGVTSVFGRTGVVVTLPRTITQSTRSPTPFTSIRHRFENICLRSCGCL